MASWVMVETPEEDHSIAATLMRDDGVELGAIIQFETNPQVTYAHAQYFRIGPVEGWENAKRRVEEMVGVGKDPRR